MIKQIRHQGAYIVDIASQIGCSEKTVRRYLQYPSIQSEETWCMEKLRHFVEYVDTQLDLLMISTD